MQHHKEQRARTHAAILKAAEGLFLEKGYLTNVQEILEAAGISRATLFDHFDSKEILFRAVMREIGNRELSGILDPLKDRDDFFGALARFAKNFPGRVLSSDRLAIHRLAIVESRSFPEFARSHYHEGMARVLPALRDCLEHGQRQRWVRAGNTLVLAEQFAASLLGYRQYRAILGQPDVNGTDSDYVELAVAGLLTSAGLKRWLARPLPSAPSKRRPASQGAR